MCGLHPTGYDTVAGRGLAPPPSIRVGCDKRIGSLEDRSPSVGKCGVPFPERRQTGDRDHEDRTPLGTPDHRNFSLSGPKLEVETRNLRLKKEHPMLLLTYSPGSGLGLVSTGTYSSEGKGSKITGGWGGGITTEKVG